MKCRDCKFFVDDCNFSHKPGERYGHCHRYPPNGVRRWTITTTEDYCGEFKPKEDEKG